ncbi:MAG: hypothetical protein J6N52_10645 [Clostridia bacterium]|nr:hypothetical protein [Clostridia bacterium]
MKKILLFLLLFICFCGIIFAVRNPLYYNLNYWEDIKLHGSHLYSNVITQKGDPQEINCINNEGIVNYADTQFIWYNTELQGIFSRVEIIKDTIFLGKKRLCIGSNKNDVEKAYRSIFIKRIHDLPQNSLGYIDNNVYIVYNFDNYDKVEKIIISHGL